MNYLTEPGVNVRRGLGGQTPRRSTLINHGDIVLDPFLGSGSTLIAAERTGRCCRGVELRSTLRVDVILRRYQSETGRPAVLEATGETFVENVPAAV